MFADTAAFCKTIADAAHFYVIICKRSHVAKPFPNVVRSCGGLQAEMEIVRYLRDLNIASGVLQRFWLRHIAEITTADIEPLAARTELGPVSRNTFPAPPGYLFKFQKTHGWCRTIPAAESARSRDIWTRAEFDTKGTWRSSERSSEETVPYWAIGAFAGPPCVRIERLTRRT